MTTLPPLVDKNGTKELFQLFEEVQSWKLELKLITPIFITGCYFGAMVAILDIFNNRQILEFKESKQLS